MTDTIRILDRKKANNIVKEYLAKGEQIYEAVVQLRGDENWNTETIWKGGKFRRKRDFKCYPQSNWAIPVCRLYFSDGKEQVFDCFKVKTGLESAKQEYERLKAKFG